MKLTFILTIVSYLFVFLLTIVLLKFFKNYAMHKGLLDQPNHRSSHIMPTPRGGGVIFIITALIFWLGFLLVKPNDWLHTLVFAPALLIAAIGYVDDKFNLTPHWRFLIQVLATLISLIILGGFNQISVDNWVVNLSWVGSMLAFLFIIWSINLFNFMDGTDGIAAVEAIFVLGIGGVLLWLSGGHTLALLLAGLVACVLGFLMWNWPVAKIFMGDAGSGFLGFMVAVTALVSQKHYGVSLLLWFILYSAFIVDATLTLIRRVLTKERWYEAHRLHAYQRLHQFGWSHQKILSRVIVLNSILAILAILGFYHPDLILVNTAIAFLLVIRVYLYIERRKPMYPAQ